MIIYTIQTNLDFEANEKISADFFNFYELCRKKLRELIDDSGLNLDQ